MDWSDAEAKGLREAVGDETADSILHGCNVHWTRSYQRVAERVVAKEKLAIDAFCKIAKCINGKGQNTGYSGGSGPIICGCFVNHFL